MLRGGRHWGGRDAISERTFGDALNAIVGQTRSRRAVSRRQFEKQMFPAIEDVELSVMTVTAFAVAFGNSK